MLARHSSLKPISHFLHTSKPAQTPSMFEGGLLEPSPIPLSRGPTKEAPPTDLLRPLYFVCPPIFLNLDTDKIASESIT